VPQPPPRRNTRKDNLLTVPEQTEASQLTPKMPKSNHRKTMIAPQNSDLKLLRQILHENLGPLQDRKVDRLFPEDSIDDPELLSVTPGRGILSTVSNENPVWDKSGVDRSSTVSSQLEKSMDNIANGELNESDMALVLYEFQAQSEDDLDALEGDVIQILSIEGEWVYALLLMPTEPGSNEYVPALIDGRTPAGWLPLDFTCPLTLTPPQNTTDI
jgi:hypothetical protein